MSLAAGGCRALVRSARAAGHLVLGRVVSAEALDSVADALHLVPELIAEGVQLVQPDPDKRLAPDNGNSLRPSKIGAAWRSTGRMGAPALHDGAGDQGAVMLSQVSTFAPESYVQPLLTTLLTQKVHVPPFLLPEEVRVT